MDAATWTTAVAWDINTSTKALLHGASTMRSSKLSNGVSGGASSPSDTLRTMAATLACTGTAPGVLVTAARCSTPAPGTLAARMLMGCCPSVRAKNPFLLAASALMRTATSSTGWSPPNLNAASWRNATQKPCGDMYGLLGRVWDPNTLANALSSTGRSSPAKASMFVNMVV